MNIITAAREKMDLVLTHKVASTYLEFLNPKPTLALGDIIVWRDGMANKTRPLKGELAIVTSVITPVMCEGERFNGTPLFREPLDIIVALIDDDGELIEYHFDSRRFRLATDKEILVAAM